jgi:hypothetical protein
MDMIPMNNTYYTEHIKEYDNTKFVYYRDNVCVEYSQFAMCYNAAVPNVWKDIFNIHNLDDIKILIKKISENNIIDGEHGKEGWCIDQLYLYQKVIEWNKRTNNLVCLKEEKTKFRRLDRAYPINMSDNLKQGIALGIYTDYHCYRPMSEYANINYEIYNSLQYTNP